MRPYLVAVKEVKDEINHDIILKSQDLRHSLRYPWLHYIHVHLVHVNLHSNTHTHACTRTIYTMSQHCHGHSHHHYLGGNVGRKFHSLHQFLVLVVKAAVLLRVGALMEWLRIIWNKPSCTRQLTRKNPASVIFALQRDKRYIDSSGLPVV